MNKIEIATIRNLYESNSVRWSDHIIKRMFQRNISTNDIECVLMNGEIIEEYPDDYPYPIPVV